MYVGLVVIRKKYMLTVFCFVLHFLLSNSVTISRKKC